MTTTLNDLDHFWSGDVAVSPTGDLGPASDSTRTKQRILRRLLTNPAQKDSAGNVIVPGDYIWHPDYGAGLPRYVGEIIDFKKITSLVRGQVLLEAAVARNPEPVIELQEITNGISCTIRYNDAVTGKPETLSFNVTA